MKTMKNLLLLGAFSCAALVANALTKDSLVPRPIRLQVTVTVPPSMNLIRDDDIADAFAYRVSAGLSEQGFKGRVEYVRVGDDPKTDIPVLSISLIEWRVDRIGNVDCTFAANLSGPNGKESLGLFAGSSMMLWPRHDYFARVDGYEDAASSALSDLAKRLNATKIIPVPESKP